MAVAMVPKVALAIADLASTELAVRQAIEACPTNPAGKGFAGCFALLLRESGTRVAK